MTDTAVSMNSVQQRVEMGDIREERCKTNHKQSRCSPVFLAFKICGVLLLLILLITNLVVTVLLWGTNMVEKKISQDMVIENNTRSYNWWVKSPIQPYMQIRIFNYTNVDDFLAGYDVKLNVVEAGPYVYKETMERVNVVFHENGTVSYQEKRSFEYCPERSFGSLDDVLTIPNMVVLGSAAFVKNSPYLVRWSLSQIFNGIDAKPFVTRSTRELFWGYDDPLFTAAKTFLTLQGRKDEITKIGLLIARNGTSASRVAIHTGAQDISRLGVIDRYAGQDRFPHWGTDECNRIDGSDGSMFPPGMISENVTLHMFMKDMCRRFPLVFKGYVTAAGSGVEAMRFHPPRDVFETSLPENACFCPPAADNRCPPAGVFNASPCAFNAPIMFSFPHFYLGDASLLEPFTGLAPDPAKHDMFLDIHPKFGFPMAGESRFQINMMVEKSFGMKQLEHFDDETILPIAWFEVVIDEVPPEIEQVLHELHFVTYTVKWLAVWSFLGLLFITTLMLGVCMVTRVRQIWYTTSKVCSKSGGAVSTSTDLKAKNNPAS